MISVENLALRYKGRSILERVQFHVKHRQALGIIGPSGAGKSMLLKMLAKLVEPTEGRITLQSEKVSMLFQKNALFDSLSLMGNLLLPLAETLSVHGKPAETRALEMLSAVGLASSAMLYPEEISGGMQKRLGIARALIIEPEVILYDEPTAGLDPITSKSIAELMLKLHYQNSTTLVMVTNDLQRAYQISDVIGFCHDQGFAILGTPDEVKASLDPVVKNFIYSSALTPSAHEVKPG